MAALYADLGTTEEPADLEFRIRVGDPEATSELFARGRLIADNKADGSIRAYHRPLGLTGRGRRD